MAAHRALSAATANLEKLATDPFAPTSELEAMLSVSTRGITDARIRSSAQVAQDSIRLYLPAIQAAARHGAPPSIRLNAANAVRTLLQICDTAMRSEPSRTGKVTADDLRAYSMTDMNPSLQAMPLASGTMCDDAAALECDGGMFEGADVGEL